MATADPPSTGIANPIHSDDGASGAGYAGALVAGVRTYGWVAEAVIERLGEAWLDGGWADVTLRRPVFVGDAVTIDVGPEAVQATVAGRVVLDGAVGLGSAPWLGELDPPAAAPAADAPAVRSTYTLDDAPIGHALRPLGAWVSWADAERLRLDDLGQSTSHVAAGRLHPWFLAARMAPLTRHNFTYGPTIHVRTQIQHLGPAAAGHEVVVGARIVDVFERNRHWYQVLDGRVDGTAGLELARIRHHSIFRPRGTRPPS